MPQVQRICWARTLRRTIAHILLHCDCAQGPLLASKATGIASRARMTIEDWTRRIAKQPTTTLREIPSAVGDASSIPSASDCAGNGFALGSGNHAAV
jgi:hypothetical protein